MQQQFTDKLFFFFAGTLGIVPGARKCGYGLEILLTIEFTMETHRICGKMHCLFLSLSEKEQHGIFRTVLSGMWFLNCDILQEGASPWKIQHIN